MKAILCSRGKGGGGQVIDTPEAETPERCDLFGRTEREIVTAIEHGERVYNISKGYSGNEGLAINLARMRADLEVDRRMLKTVRGERVEYNPPLGHMNSAQLEQWRKDIVRLGRAGMARDTSRG